MISARFHKSCPLLFLDAGIKITIMLSQRLGSWVSSLLGVHRPSRGVSCRSSQSLRLEWMSRIEGRVVGIICQ